MGPDCTKTPLALAPGMESHYIATPPPPTQNRFITDIWWPRLQTCSNLITYRPTVQPIHLSPHYRHLVTTESRPVGTRAVCILLECFLIRYVYVTSRAEESVEPCGNEACCSRHRWSWFCMLYRSHSLQSSILPMLNMKFRIPMFV